MANYFFDTMTQAQASSFLFASDNIVFRNGPASQATVLFNPLTLTTPPSITIVYGANSLTFADDPTSVRGQGFTLFPDGSKLFIGTTGADNPVNGTAGSDALFGVTAERCVIMPHPQAVLHLVSGDHVQSVVRFPKDINESRLAWELFMPGTLHFASGPGDPSRCLVSGVGVRGLDHQILQLSRL